MISEIAQQALLFIQSQGYLLLLIGTIIEGPVVTTAAAFAASLGYFNVLLVFLIALAGDLIGDFLHFIAGHFIRKRVIEKHGKKVGISKRRLNFLEHNFKNHLKKIMIFLKLMPPLTSIGLLLIGSSKVKAKKFIFASFITTLPLSLTYTLLGFFLGSLSNSILRYIKMGELILFFFIIALLIAYLSIKIIYRKVEKIEIKEEKKL